MNIIFVSAEIYNAFMAKINILAAVRAINLMNYCLLKIYSFEIVRTVFDIDGKRSIDFVKSLIGIPSNPLDT